MRRKVMLASLLLLLALGLATTAYAGCTSCVTGVFSERSNAGTVTLNFVARAEGGLVLPDTITGVVMQVDGQRTKCAGLVMSMVQTSNQDGFFTYRGTFQVYGNYSHSGRIDFGGQIYEFTVPLDGKPGTVTLAADQTPLGRVAPPRVTAQSTFPPRETAAPATPQTSGIQLPSIEPAFIIGAGVVLLTIVGAYVDRRRALARSLAA